jgi:biotin transport system substrate-specific component
MNRIKISLRDICFIGIFAAIIAVMAQIAFPLPNGVPLSLGTFAIMFAGVILGPKKGVLAVLIYVALGAVGVPVFANFTGGIARIAGPTGGFILSFFVIALFAGMGSRGNIFTLVSCIIAGVLVNYICGMLWFAFVTSSGFVTAFTACVLPFLPGDAVKVALVTISGRQIKAALVKGKVLL